MKTGVDFKNLKKGEPMSWWGVNTTDNRNFYFTSVHIFMKNTDAYNF